MYSFYQIHCSERKLLCAMFDYWFLLAKSIIDDDLQILHPHDLSYKNYARLQSPMNMVAYLKISTSTTLKNKFLYLHDTHSERVTTFVLWVVTDYGKPLKNFLLLLADPHKSFYHWSQAPKYVGFFFICYEILHTNIQQ